ncbi:MAG: helix-turn-helix domain-containing protein [Candidatus Competibacteraceae bacterium]
MSHHVPLLGWTRDRAIVELHRQGLNNRAVGRQLGCSEATVRRALKEQV